MSKAKPEVATDTATSAPSAQKSQRHRGAQRTDADRADDRERQRRSRQNRAAKEEEDEIRELANELKKAIRESRDGTVPRWFFVEHGVTATMAAMQYLGIASASTQPGVPIQDEDPEKVKARSEQFDRMKAECERKSSEETKRVLWILSQGIPMSYGPAYFPNGIPPTETKDAK
jgi:hypothetical protein